MKVEHARKELRLRCDKRFQSEGFRFFAARGGYRRIESGCEYVLHVRLVSQGGAVVMVLSASVRVVEIEKVFHQISGMKAGDQKLTSTLWVTAAALQGRASTELDRRIMSDSDVEPAALEVISFYETHAKGYFATHGSVAAVDDALNQACSAPSRHQVEPRRSEYGLIAAWLLKRSDFDRVAEEHHAALAALDRGIHLPEYERLLALLRGKKG